MDNTTLGSVAVGFYHILNYFGHANVQLVSRSIQVSIIAPKCPIFVAGDALKCGFIRPHDFFLVINTSVNISPSKLKTLLPHTSS